MQRAEVTAHTVKQTTGGVRTVILMKFDAQVFDREKWLKGTS